MCLQLHQVGPETPKCGYILYEQPLWYDSKQRPVVSSFSRGTVFYPTVAGGEGGFWIWAWAFLGPVCIFLDPIESVWGDLVENCSTLHLSEEHANNCSTSVLMNDHWSSHVEAPWHVHVTIITIFFPCLTNFDVLCAQMSTSKIGMKLDICRENLCKKVNHTLKTNQGLDHHFCL